MFNLLYFKKYLIILYIKQKSINKLLCFKFNKIKIFIFVQHNSEVIIMGNKMKKTKNKHKNVNHNPQVESVKACFGEPKAKPYDPTDFKI